MRIALAVLLTSLALPAAAQPNGSVRIPQHLRTPPQLPLEGNGFALPMIDYVAPDGSLQRKRGIVAGMDVSRTATVGVGFFETTRKKGSTSGDPTKIERRKKRAALGVSIQF